MHHHKILTNAKKFYILYFFPDDLFANPLTVHYSKQIYFKSLPEYVGFKWEGLFTKNSFEYSAVKYTSIPKQSA